MLRLGGSKVNTGKWWSAVDGSVSDLSRGGVLPGDINVLYVRRPAGGIFVVVPALAALYALSFPMHGPAVVIAAWSCALLGTLAVGLYGLKKLPGIIGELAVMGWRPVRAYLAGFRKRSKK